MINNALVVTIAVWGQTVFNIDVLNNTHDEKCVLC